MKTKRTLKKATALVLTFIMVFSVAPVSELSRLSDFFDGFGISAQAASESDLTFSLINDDTEYMVSDCTSTAADELVIPSTYNGKPVTSIGNRAFDGCTSLISVTIPDSVTSIGEWAFFGCRSLSSVTIPDSVTSIGYRAFSNCTSLSSVTVPDSVTSIGALAYRYTAWYDNQPDGLVYIGKVAYEYKGTMPDGTAIVIVDGTKSISDSAFSNCTGLSSITIPDSVTNIESSAFYGCTGLSDITVSSANANYSSQDGVLFNKDKTCLILYPAGNTRTSYSIPGGVTSIENGAIKNCIGLSSITIPDSVISIGDEIFYKCSNLSSVTLGNSVENIGNDAFQYCVGLSSITIPDSVTSIGDEIFYECSNLSSVTLGNSVENIGNDAFQYCIGLSSITIPDSVTSIGINAFYECTGLISVTIGYSLTSIGDMAFSSCTALSDITVSPANATYSSQDGVLYNKNITGLIKYPVGNTRTSYSIPDSVTSISEMAFADCTWLREITVSSANANLSSQDGVLYNKNITGLIQYPVGNTRTSYTIPDSVTRINSYAFSNCTALCSVTIGYRVTSIGNSAFFNCVSLSEVFYGGDLSDRQRITIYSDNEKLSNATWHYSIRVTDVMLYITDHDIIIGATRQITVFVAPGNATNKNVTWESSDTEIATVDENGLVTAKAAGTATITVTTVDGDKTARCDLTVKDVTSILTFKLINNNTEYEISGCNYTGIFPLIIPAAYRSKPVTSIGEYAFFNCTGISSVTFPDSVTNIGDYAFKGCTGISSVTIGSSVTSIGGSAFYGCTELSSVIIPGSVTSIGGSAFYGCTGLSSVTIPGSVTSIGSSAFFGCTSLSDVTIPGSVASIAEDTFSGCTGLSSIAIPDSVTSIGSSAFYGCTSLSSVTIPDSVTSIGNSVFSGCTGLSSVTISDRLTSIGNYAFEGCTGLGSVTIPDNVTSISNYAFYGCTGLSSVTIPDRLTSIGNYAFYSCTGLSSVTIPDRLTSIGNYAFYNCTGLSSVTIPDSVTNIGESAFRGCTGLSNITVSSANENYSSQDGVLFNKDKTYLIHYPTGNTRTSYSIPDSVKNISYRLFYCCTSLNSVTISDSMTSIENGAFYGCTGLRSVTVSYNVTSIGSSAFEGCTELSDIYYGGNESNRAEIVIGSGNERLTDATWHYSIRVTDVELDITDITLFAAATQQLTATVTPEDAANKAVIWTSSNIDIVAVDENGLLTAKTVGTATITATTDDGGKTASCTVTVNDVTSVLTYILIDDNTAYEISDCDDTATGILIIPPTYNGRPVTSISENAFSGCTGLSSVTIGNRVTGIGSGAFSGCTSLSSITIPDSVKSIGENAFYNTAWYNNQSDGLVYIGKVAYKYKGTMPDGTAINITDGTKGIADAAFFNCTGLNSVTIPDSVTSIGESAFNGCMKLSTVTIPDSVTNISSSVFSGCTSLSTVTIPDNVTSIGSGAFYGCMKLSTVTIPDSVTSIGNYAFKFCTQLSTVAIPDSVTSIGNYAFEYCTKLSMVTVGNSVTSIGSRVFFGCTELSTVTIPDRVTSIGSSAFEGCTSLSTVTLPDRVTSIGSSAFEDCTSLSTVTIPDSVTSIGEYAFRGCTGLVGITVSSSNANYSSQDGALYNKNKICLIQYPAGSARTSYSVPDSVTRIDESAFLGSTNLSTVTIGYNLTSIGDGAFSDCTGLADVYYGGDESNRADMAIGSDNEIFTGATWHYSIRVTDVTLDITDTTLLVGATQPLTATVAPEDATNQNIIWTSSDTAIATVDENGLLTAKAAGTATITVTTVDGDKTASCTVTVKHVTSTLSLNLINGNTAYEISYCVTSIEGALIIPAIYNGKPVTSIGDRAFYGCTSLGSVIIPDSVTSIGDHAFDGCETLSSITIPDSVMSIGSSVFFGCTSLSTVTIPDKVKSIGDYAFNGCTGLNSVTIPDSVTSIGNYAFFGCTSLSTVTIPDKVKSIGDYAFNGCTGLNSVTIPDSVTSIGNYVFEDCTGLSTVTIPNSVTSIGDYAFNSCMSLSTVTFGNSVTSIGDSAFCDCIKLSSVTVPDSVTSIGDSAFFSCTSLSTVTFGNSVTSIGNSAFEDCTGLSTVTIPDSVTSIGNSVFSGCTSLSTVTISDRVTSIGYEAFCDCTGLSSVTIPDSVTSIDSYAFSGCTSLSSVTIGNGVTSIGSYAFCNCTNLSTVTIPDRVTSVGSWAFSGCTGLSTITISDSVTSISESAFSGCTNLSTVTIPDRVTSISNGTFYDCTNLSSVTIGNSVTGIGEDAFYGCTELNTITIPESVISIGENAFCDCTKLSTVTIPLSVTDIGDKAFLNCSSLSDVYYDGNESDRAEIAIGSDNYKLNSAIWYYTFHVTGVMLNISDKTLAVGAIQQLTATVAPENATYQAVTWSSSDTQIATVDENGLVTAIAAGTATITVTAVDGGKTASCLVTVKDVTSILTFELINGDTEYEITDCDDTAIGVLIIPATYNGKPVTSIGNHAFFGCTNLSTVTIPDSVTSIDSFGFFGCVGLTDIMVNAANANYFSQDGVLFNKDKTCLIQYPAKSARSSFSIPDSVTSIGEGAFANSTGLSTVTIPDSVEYIGEFAFYKCTGLSSVTIPDSVTNINSGAFSECLGLTDIIVSSANANYSSQDGVLFNKDMTCLIQYPAGHTRESYSIPDSVTSIGEGAFAYCTWLDSFTIPDGVTSIGEGAFAYCTWLNSFTIPAGVTSIGEDTFYGCSSLSSVTIGYSVTGIGDDAFSDCTGLTDVYYGGNESNRAELAFGSGNENFIDATWHYSIRVTDVTLDITDTTLLVGVVQQLIATVAPEDATNKNITWTSSNTAIATVDDNGFLTAKAAGTATVTVTTVDGDKTASCSVTVNDVASILTLKLINGDTAYEISDCVTSAADTLIIPATYNGKPVTSIGDEAFSDCTGLSSITIPDSVTSIGAYAFRGCTGLCSITVSSTNENYSCHAGVLFNKDMTCLIQYPAGHTRESYSVPNSVTSIENWAFYNCTGLSSVTISDSVTTIGKSAFEGSTKLSSVTIGNSVESIGEDAFFNCKVLDYIMVSFNNSNYSSRSSVLFNKDKTCLIQYPIGNTRISYSIPDSVTSIGSNAFYGCSSLSSVTIPDSVTSFGEGAFSGCTGLSTVTIPKRVTSIGYRAFSGCTGLSSITIPNSVTSICYRAFSGCTGISSVTISYNLTSIGDGVFFDCTGLTDVYYSGDESNRAELTIGSDNEIFTGATWHYSVRVTDVTLDITDITLLVGATQPLTATVAPEDATNQNITWTSSVTAIATVDKNGLLTAKAAGTATITVTTVDGDKTASCTVTVKHVTSTLALNLINGNTAYEISNCVNSVEGALIIPATYNGKPVTSVGHEAFHGCTGLNSITIPDSVTSIGYRAFYGCTGLSSVAIGNRVTSIGLYAFYDTAWYNNQPDGIVYIGKVAYKYKGTMPNGTAIVISDSTKSITEKAFSDCTGLSSVTIPNSVTNIGSSVFFRCTGLRDITVSSANANYSSQDGVLFNIDKTYLIHYPAGNTRTSYSIPDSVTSIGNYAFRDSAGLSSVTIGNGLTSIGDEAFYGCTGLNDITAISSNANYSSQDGVLYNKDKTCLIQYPEGNTRTSYSIPDSVTSIGSYAFRNCTNLSSVAIPDSVTSIGEYAFYGCAELSSVTITDRLTSIGDYAFYGCTGLGSITIGNRVTSVGESAFENCTGLSTVTIGNSVTSIGDYAFYYCTTLSAVTLGYCVTSIGSSAFSDCTRLSDIYYDGNSSDRTKIAIGSDNEILINATWHYTIRVTNVTLDITDKNLAIGEVQQLTATVAPEDATNKAVTWVSSDTEIATVDKNGLVTAKAVGTATITVTTIDGGKSCTFEVNVIDVTLESVIIKTMPSKLSYFVGDTLDKTGLTLTATYYDSSTREISAEDIACTPARLNTAGMQTVTVAYGGKTCTFEVNVIDVTLISIAVKTTPDKLDYFVSETLNSTGLSIELSYSNGTKVVMTSGFTCSPTALSTAGTQTVTVSYSGKNCTFDVTVIAVALSTIEVKTEPTKTTYYVGDTLDSTGLTLTATYNNGTQETVSEGFECSPTALSTAGTQTVTVTYSGKTCTFDVTVNPNLNVPKYTVSNSKGIVGQTVNVTVSIENNPGLVAANLNISYDSAKLLLVSVTDGNLLGTGTFVAGNDLAAIPHTVFWEDALATADYTQNGVLVTYTFEILENAEAGTTPITVTYDQDSTFNSEIENVEFAVVNGSVEIAYRIPGDANGDGEVNLKDVVAIRRWFAGGWNVTIDESNADVNGDNEVNLKDVVIIRRYLAGGWNVVLI